MKQIKKKKYYKITFSTESPLSIGSGNNNRTDNDIIKNSEGKPYIPASAIAGVMKERLNIADNDRYFGFVKKNTGNPNDADQSESTLVFYDATILEETSISVRDNVALDEYKTAKKGSKFDREVLEAGAKFVTFVEQEYYRDEDEPDYAKDIAAAFLAKDVVFGSKSSRGFGRIKDVNVLYREYDLTDKDQLNKWIEFDIFEENNWDEDTELVAAESGSKVIDVVLIQKEHSGISIRKYTTEPRTSDKDTVPDMEQLVSSGYPVIPGSSWAGAFKHQMERYGRNYDDINSIYGYKKKNSSEKNIKSRLEFRESVIKEAEEKIITRNSIDRFTGGTVDRALFTERTYYGGNLHLQIEWKSKDSMPDEDKSALAASIADLHYGLLSVGGETSIGRGLFKILTINEEEVDDDTVFDIAKKVIEEVF